MLNAILSSPWHLQRARRGPSGRHIDQLAVSLLEQGYPYDTARHKIGLVVSLSQWLEKHQYDLIALDENKVESFLRSRSRRRTIQGGDRMTLRLLLDHLRLSGDIPRPAPKARPSQLEHALHEYTEYLVRERGFCRNAVASGEGATTDRFS